LRTLVTPLEGVHGVAFSPDGRFLATAGGRFEQSAGKTPGLLQVWEVASGKEVHRLAADPDVVRAVAFSPDGRRPALAGGNNSVVLLDGGTFQEVRRLGGLRTYVYKLTFSPDGTRLATAGEDGAVRIWDPATGDEVNTLRGHTADVGSVAYS